MIECSIVLSAELYAYASALFRCLAVVLYLSVMKLVLCSYAIPMIKIRHKKETIKVPYNLVFIVLFLVLTILSHSSYHSGYQLLVYYFKIPTYYKIPTNYRIPTNL